MTRTITHKIDLLNTWYTSPVGRCMLPIERGYIDKFLPNLYGYHLVQVGGPVDFTFTQSSPIHHQVQMGPVMGKRFPGDWVHADGECLPLRPNSIDLVFCPHTLECLEDPMAGLVDMVESLVTGGHLMLTGFNPWSLLGAWARNSQDPFFSELNWCGPSQMQDWLRSLGMTVKVHVTYFFRPPVPQRAWLQKLLLMDTVGQFICPDHGGAFLMVAQKGSDNLLKIRQQQAVRRRRMVVGRAVEPSHYDAGV